MESILIPVGLMIYVLYNFVNRFVYKIPNMPGIIISTSGILCILAGAVLKLSETAG